MTECRRVSMREESEKKKIEKMEGTRREMKEREVGFKAIKHQNKHIRTKGEQEVGQIATAQMWKNYNAKKKKKKKNKREREGH